MVESDPTVQELHAEVGRLKQELSDSTSHYNGIINDFVKLREEASTELERLKAEYDSSNKAFYEQIRVQKNISDAHYKSYCEMLKRVDAVVRERDKTLAEVAQLRAERDLAQQLGRDEVSAELERLKTELAQAISERTPHDYGLLKYTIESLKAELHEARTKVERLKGDVANQMEINRAVAGMKVPTRLEPSRIEIAAMVLSGLAADHLLESSREQCIKDSIYMADALIAAAKEVAK